MWAIRASLMPILIISSEQRCVHDSESAMHSQAGAWERENPCNYRGNVWSKLNVDRALVDLQHLSYRR